MLLHPLALAGLLVVTFAAGYALGRVNGWYARERKFLVDAARDRVVQRDPYPDSFTETS